jgi:hypothetical protein
MATKTKAEEDTCEEHSNSRKKRKTFTLLLKDENKNVANLKYLVEEGFDVRTTIIFLLSELKRYVQFPVEFSAAILDHVVEVILRKFPRVHVMKKKKKTPDCLILPPNIDREQLIDVLELFGAAFVFQAKADFRKFGWICWHEATMLRDKYRIAKISLPQSELETLLFGNVSEFRSMKELFALFPQRGERWTIHALCTCLRISNKNNCPPDSFFVNNLFKFALQGWADRNVPRHRAFTISLHLFELFGKTDFLDQLVKNETNMEDVVHSSFTEFFNTLRLWGWDPQRIETELATVLTFDHMMTSLVFSFVYQVKVHKDARNDQIKIKDYTIKSKADKLEEISQLILILIKLLVSMPKSEAEREKLKNHLESYTINFENNTLKKKQSTLLLRASEDYRGFEEDFEFIMLLLETGGDPNAVDQHGRSPLHVLASREVFFHPFWSFDYEKHAARFTTIVQTFFDGEFHKDQTDLRGNAALDCIKYFPQQYPNDKLRKLMDSYLQGVLPLSCIAAKIVRKHNLPCEDLPLTLQSMVLQHSSFQYC